MVSGLDMMRAVSTDHMDQREDGMMKQNQQEVAKTQSVAMLNLDSCCTRVFHYLLFNPEKDHTVESFIGNVFPLDMTIEEATAALKNDKRLNLVTTDEECLVKISSFSDSDRKLFIGVNTWKEEMAKYFREHCCDLKLCMLPQIIRRPESLSKDVKLIDILNSDPQKRFLLINSSPSNKKNSDDIVVKYKHTPKEIEFYHDQWRDNIARFLLKEYKSIPLVTVGTHVKKPRNLGKNQKLIDVVKADPDRFLITPDPIHNSLTRISLTEKYCLNLWKYQILNILNDPTRRKPSCEQDLLHLAPRPAPLNKRIMPSDVVGKSLTAQLGGPMWQAHRSSQMQNQRHQRQEVRKHPHHISQQYACRSSPPVAPSFSQVMQPAAVAPPPGFNDCGSVPPPAAISRQVSFEILPEDTVLSSMLNYLGIF
jgi:hypothetical protein